MARLSLGAGAGILLALAGCIDGGAGPSAWRSPSDPYGASACDNMASPDGQAVTYSELLRMDWSGYPAAAEGQFQFVTHAPALEGEAPMSLVVYHTGSTPEGTCLVHRLRPAGPFDPTGGYGGGTVPPGPRPEPGWDVWTPEAADSWGRAEIGDFYAGTHAFVIEVTDGTARMDIPLTLTVTGLSEPATPPPDLRKALDLRVDAGCAGCSQPLVNSAAGARACPDWWVGSARACAIAPLDDGWRDLRLLVTPSTGDADAELLVACDPAASAFTYRHQAIGPGPPELIVPEGYHCLVAWGTTAAELRVEGYERTSGA